MFGGRLFRGRLFAGRLFGPDDDSPQPQPVAPRARGSRAVKFKPDVYGDEDQDLLDLTLMAVLALEAAGVWD
jgi:hypothetical protein